VSTSDEGRGRKTFEFSVGFVLATGVAVAIAMTPIGSVAWWIVCAVALVGAILCPLIHKLGYRYAVIGILCALILPGLMIGSACVGVRMHY